VYPGPAALLASSQRSLLAIAPSLVRPDDFAATKDRSLAGTNTYAVNFVGMNTAIGLFAALCTTCSYFPQLKKCWDTGSAGDLSLKMFLILSVGVATWIIYGFLQRDFVIIVANAVSLCLLLGILYFKIKERSAF
jgi:MtN3 and saliva related transmembrane protein